jgi:capsular polysaccharide biosynthesis protein
VAGPSAPAGGDENRRFFEENEYVLSLEDFLSFLRRWLWIIGLVALLVTGLTAGYLLLKTPVYEASATILVAQERGTTNEENPPLAAEGLQKLSGTIAEGVDSRPVAEGVIRQLDLEMTPNQLLANLNVIQVNETQFIEVSYRDPSPERAQQIANAFGDVASEQISDVNPSASAITATVWEQAQVPDSPVSPKPVRDSLLALGLGLVLGILLAYLLEYLDNSWRSPEDVERVAGAPNLAVIPEFEVLTAKKKRKKRRYQDGHLSP